MVSRIQVNQIGRSLAALGSVGDGGECASLHRVTVSRLDHAASMPLQANLSRQLLQREITPASTQ